MNDQTPYRVVEMYYTVQEIATLTRKCEQYILQRMKRGDFGPDVYCIGGRYLATASAVNAWLEKFRPQSFGVKASYGASWHQPRATEQNGK